MVLLLLEFILGLLIFMFGASIYSFLNVIVYRLPRKMSFIRGRSMCPSCGHVLGPIDMVPVLSWLCLKGKCRYCGAPVSPRYMLMEVWGGLMALLSFITQSDQTARVLFFCLTGILTVVALIDLDTMEIPNELVMVLLLLAAAWAFLCPGLKLTERLLGILAASGPMLVIALIVPGGFGGGDIKLMIPCGFILGWKLGLLALFLAVLGGGFYGIILMAGKKVGKGTHFAFGPFLCIGVLASLLWGQALLNWYLGLFGLL